MSSGFSSMLKRAAATATAAVSAAVSTIGGGGVGDEQFDSYRTRVEGLQRDMANLKDKCGLFSKAAMNMAVSGGEVGSEFRALYRSSAPRQSQVDKFQQVQQRIDEAAFRAFSIDTYGSQVLGVLDEWQADSQRVLDDIRNAETALDEVRKLQDKVAAGKAGRDKRQTGAASSQDAMLQQAEDMLARFEKNLTTQRSELDKRVNGFVDGRYAVLDSVFVRFMELQTEFAQSLVTATSTFAPSIAAYRKKVPLGSTGPLSPRSSVGNGSLSPSSSQQSLSPSTDMFASAASASASSAAGRPSSDSAQPRKSASPAKPADDDEESSDDDDSDSDDDDDDDSDDDDDETPRHSGSNHSKTKAAPAAGKLASPRVSTGGAGSTSPRNSQPSSPNGTAASGSRSTTSSPDLLNFGGGEKSNSDDLMDLFSGGAAKKAPSPTSKKPPAANSNSAPADDLSLFDFSGPAKSASPAPTAPRQAGGGKQQQPSHSSSMDFDPFAANSQPAAAAVKPAAGGAASSSTAAAASSSRPPSNLQREDSRSQLNAVAKGMVKTDDLDKHIEDQQEKRLEELRANEEEQLKDAADKKAATHALEDKLNAWSTKDGQRKNIRLLLSSLHTVLWQGSGWKPAGLADLIDLNAIKKQHRKAILIVHPDKLQDATPEQKVIAEHAFDALNTAYDRFCETGQ